MLSKKEIISILLLITAVLCVLNAALFGNIMPIPSSYDQLLQQSINAGTAYICFLHGLSTWFYHSNYSEPRRHIRYVLITMLLCLVVANVVGLSSVVKEHFVSELNQAVMINEIHSAFGNACRFITLILFILIIILLICTLVMVTRSAIRTWRKRSLSDSLRNEELP